MWTTIVGGLAVCLTSVGWIPQIARAVRTRSADDFSVSWILLFGSGVFCWLVYGLITGDRAIIVANVIAFSAVAFLASLRLWPAVTAWRLRSVGIDGSLAGSVRLGASVPPPVVPASAAAAES